jgi:hypothetical protein
MVLRPETIMEPKGAATKVRGTIPVFPSRLSLVALCTATTLAATATFAVMPPPPWGDSAPTSSAQVLSYVHGVMSNLPPETVDQIHAAQKRKASAGELLSILYNAQHSASTSPATFSSLICTNTVPQPQFPWLMASVTNTSDRIAMLKQMYGDQWRVLGGSSGEGTPYGSRLINTFAVCRELEDLERRIGNQKDELTGLDSYTNVFLIDGAAMSLFWHAKRMYDDNDRSRAANLLRLLISPHDTESFSRGSSYHILANILKERKDYTNAFIYEMMVHRFNACLVFTANAYITAASILERVFHQHQNALALLAVDVPTPEFSQKCPIRHLMMADISFKQHDFTNMARHIQMACAWDPKNKDMIRYWESQCPALSDVWGYAMTNPWSAVDITSTISKGLSSPFKTPDDSLFLDAVSHDWPAMSSIPQSIMTNLLLCNNILTNNSQGNIASNQLHMRMPCH